MAAVAVRICLSESVVVADVALRTLADDTGRRSLMRSGQRPAGNGVVEGNVGPSDGVMAGGAVARDKGVASGRVRGIVGLRPCRGVAVGVAAIGGLGGEAVVTADMTGRAAWNFTAIGNELMRIREREAGAAVIEFAVGPDGDGVAGRAGGWGVREVGSDVIGHVSVGRRIGGVPRGSMATHAVCRLDPVIVIDMAVGAGSGSMSPNQRKACNAVIKGCAIPAFGSVAVRAIGSDKIGSGTGVDRSRGLLPRSEMAGGVAAIGRGDLQGVIVTAVAGGTSDVGVAVGQ